MHSGGEGRSRQTKKKGKGMRGNLAEVNKKVAPHRTGGKTYVKGNQRGVKKGKITKRRGRKWKEEPATESGGGGGKGGGLKK